MNIDQYLHKDDTILKMPLAVFEEYHKDVQNRCGTCKGAGFPIRIVNNEVRGFVEQNCPACRGLAQ